MTLSARLERLCDSLRCDHRLSRRCFRQDNRRQQLAHAGEFPSERTIRSGLTSVDAMKEGTARVLRAQYGEPCAGPVPGASDRQAGGATLPGRLGVIVGKVQFEVLEAQWHGTDDEAFVTDDYGVVVITSGPNWRFTATRPLSSPEQSLLMSSEHLGWACLWPRFRALMAPRTWRRETPTSKASWTVHILHDAGKERDSGPIERPRHQRPRWLAAQFGRHGSRSRRGRDRERWRIGAKPREPSSKDRSTPRTRELKGHECPAVAGSR